MNKWHFIGSIGLGATALWLLARPRRASAPAYSYGGPPLRDGVDRDPHKLVPAFANRIEILMQRMRARGFDPLFWEGYRTPERARALAKKGTGIALSMHSYGAAGDILSESKLWEAPPAFWRALGEEAEKLNLTWGGRWSEADMPHVQALPLSDQDMFRAMTATQQRAFITSRLA